MPRGEKHSIATKLKIRHAQMGKNNSMYGRSGPRSPRWRGGLTPLNFQIRNSLQNRQWAQKIKERDHYACQECGRTRSKNTVLTAHHLKTFSAIIRDKRIKNFQQAATCKELWDIANGLTLCQSCHEKTPSYLNKSGALCQNG